MSSRRRRFETKAWKIKGEVLASPFDRGRYATDASFYQITPQAALVIDFSKHLNGLVSLDAGNRTAVVEPGMVLDELNRKLKPQGLWFPVDISTSSRATIGGMAANNSCGSRSIRYGRMRDNTLAIDALMADGTRQRFAEGKAPTSVAPALRALGEREADEIAARFPKVQRRVGSYNIDALTPGNNALKWGDILIGSEGTLAVSERIEILLSPTLTNKTLGVCHFPSFYEAMEAAQHLVTLDPVAVELVDRNMIELGRAIPTPCCWSSSPSRTRRRTCAGCAPWAR